MRRYWLKFAALALLVALPFVGYFGYVQSLPPQMTGSIMGTVRHKVELLETTPGPRLILAGGSSSPYATNCEAIGTALGTNCINVGVTAYFGVGLYISMLEATMRPGDVVVIAPEHSMLANSVDYTTLWSGVENFPQVLRLVPASYWPGMARGYYGYSRTKLDLYREHGAANAEGYNPAFGPLGDVVEYRETLLEVGYIRTDPIALGPDTLDDDVVKALNAFYRKAQRAGVAVYFAFAPVDKLALTTPPAEWQALEDAIRSRIEMPVLGKGSEAIMDGEYFYDSNNHLTSEGAALYSARLVEALQNEAG